MFEIDRVIYGIHLYQNFPGWEWEAEKIIPVYFVTQIDLKGGGGGEGEIGRSTFIENKIFKFPSTAEWKFFFRNENPA